MFILPKKDEAIDDGLPTSVVFRRWRQEPGGSREGAIIALFPYLAASVTNGQNECACYEHVGQHGAAEYMHVIENTRSILTALDHQEVNALTVELSDRGYTLAPITHEQVCMEIGRKEALDDVIAPAAQ